MKKNNFRYINLQQLVFVSSLSALSIALNVMTLKILGFARPLKKLFWLDFLQVIPFLIMPLYNKNYFVVSAAAFLSEFVSFWLRKTLYLYNPLLSVSFSFCWGFLPLLMLKNKDMSFLKHYLIITFIAVMHFFLFTLLNFFFIDVIFSKKEVSFTTLLQDNFMGRFLMPFLYIKFISVFLVSFLITYLYRIIKKQLLNVFSFN
ncbi:hypothetical protein [Vaccinium witches'-broom phytoplasma]|uniref:hypothetical protein n=1 Tax=Vaccinium witches'-broom phytoplasma TaxID=85642 RepID=UPI00035D531B|nr:hypothetical protein [Vaccinium witches'-broom phytoplasma]